MGTDGEGERERGEEMTSSACSGKGIMDDFKLNRAEMGGSAWRDKVKVSMKIRDMICTVGEITPLKFEKKIFVDHINIATDNDAIINFFSPNRDRKSVV